MAYRLREDYVFIGEGAADNALMKSLLKARNLPSFDYPFPDGIRRKKGNAVEDKEESVGGKDSFAEKLKLLEPVADEQRRSRGILIATDCGDNWKAAFANVAAQVASTGFYPRPEAPLKAVSPNPKQSAYLPKLVIVMVPGVGESESESKSESGGLETLCVEVLRDRHPKTAECLDQYLACLDGKGVGINGWGAETRSKVEMQCLIAVTNKDDPNKSGRYAIEAGLIDVTHPAFDALAADLQTAIEALS